MSKKAMAKKKVMKKRDDGDDKLFAFLATFLTIIGFILALLLRRDNEYVMFYAKQGLVLFIIQIIASIVSAIPFIGWIAGFAIWILFLIVWIAAWINALSGEKRRTLVVGEYAEKIRL